MLRSIFDWSEVWALLAPISVLVYKPKLLREKPVAIYVLVAIVLNFIQDYIWKNGVRFSFSVMQGDNQFLYNLNCIVRFFLLSWFFVSLHKPVASTLEKMIPFFFLLFVIINFSFFESFMSFSSRTMGLEAGLLLTYCMLYYLKIFMQEEYVQYRKMPSFWLVTGLSIYMVINFPIFLFYKSLSEKFRHFAIGLWDIHNAAYIVLCIFITIYFYAVSRK